MTVPWRNGSVLDAFRQMRSIEFAISKKPKDGNTTCCLHACINVLSKETSVQYVDERLHRSINFLPWGFIVVSVFLAEIHLAAPRCNRTDRRNYSSLHDRQRHSNVKLYHTDVYLTTFRLIAYWFTDVIIIIIICIWAALWRDVYDADVNIIQESKLFALYMNPN